MKTAIIQIELKDGSKFRWPIPEKYAWKLFLERWSKKEKVEEEIKEDDFGGKFEL